MHENWRKMILVFGLILVTILIGHIWFWWSGDIFTRNDLEANLLQIRYVRMTKFSSNWNPYIGLPVWQDPLLGILNPFWGLPLIFFKSAQSAVKVAYFLSLIMCGIGTYYLARWLKISWKIALILAITFLVSGYPAARIIVGHSEKVLSLAFMPWILFLLLRKRNSVLTGFFIALPLWSGDIYAFVYSLIIAGVLLRFKELVWGLMFGLVRIIPIWQISSYLYKPIEPFAGSQNLFSIGYHLFFPVKYFWNKFGLMNWVPTNFAWNEKTAYIGLLSVFAFFTKNNKLKVLTVTLILLAMPGWGMNPVNWIVKGVAQVQMFHSPTRVFGYLSLVVLVMAGTIIKNKYLWVINLTFCIILTGFAYTQRQWPKISTDMGGVDYVVANKKFDEILAFDQLQNPIHVLAAQESRQRMLATNYGVMLKGSEAEKWLKFRLGQDRYQGVLPDYIIYPIDHIFDLDSIFYKRVFQSADFYVYQKL